MRRSIPTMLGLGLALALASSFGPGEARAQWGYGMYPGGYGGYGWGGWGGAGSTVGGSVAQGLGMFNVGAGVYNEKTAIATSINYDTMMRWNQYVYEAQREATHQYYARKNAHLANNKEAYSAFLKKLNDNPDARDIQQGDALNAALDQLSDPRIQPSTLRGVNIPVDASLVREIPFTKASEAITVSLEQLKDATTWPRALRDSRFAPEQKEFEALVTQARQEDADGEIAPETLAKARALANRIKEKLDQTPLTDRAEATQAKNFVKTLIALTRLLEKPQIEQVISELRKIEKTSIGNLIGFMRTFNVRFGPATTPAQRNAYMELYPLLDQARDRVYSEARLDDTATAKTKNANLHDFFSAMEMEHVQGKKPAVPPTPQP